MDSLSPRELKTQDGEWKMALSKNFDRLNYFNSVRLT